MNLCCEFITIEILKHACLLKGDPSFALVFVPEQIQTIIESWKVLRGSCLPRMLEDLGLSSHIAGSKTKFEKQINNN